MLTILTNISSIFINILKLPQSFDDVKILSCPCHYQLGTFVKTVIQHLQGLQNMSPVFTLVVQAFIEHIHNLIECFRPIVLELVLLVLATDEVHTN